jgi:hypothetical protein
MTSFRQIEADRKNALHSNGPKTEEGKRQSRRNALRHGLTAETVIEGLEDSENYRGFETAVIADYDARTAVERELVLRLASLLGCGVPLRLRPTCSGYSRKSCANVEPRLVWSSEPLVEPEEGRGSKTRSPRFVFEAKPEDESNREYEPSPCRDLPESVRDLTYCFLRLGNLDAARLNGSGATMQRCGSKRRRRCFYCTQSDALEQRPDIVPAARCCGNGE